MFRESTPWSCFDNFLVMLKKKKKIIYIVHTYWTCMQMRFEIWKLNFGSSQADVFRWRGWENDDRTLISVNYSCSTLIIFSGPRIDSVWLCRSETRSAGGVLHTWICVHEICMYIMSRVQPTQWTLDGLEQYAQDLLNRRRSVWRHLKRVCCRFAVWSRAGLYLPWWNLPQCNAAVFPLCVGQSLYELLLLTLSLLEPAAFVWMN